MKTKEIELLVELEKRQGNTFLLVLYFAWLVATLLMIISILLGFNEFKFSIFYLVGLLSPIGIYIELRDRKKRKISIDELRDKMEDNDEIR